MVDSGGDPFNGPPSKTKPNHVVTITGVIEGDPTRYKVANQWGLDKDHSTEDTAISADKLVKNMAMTEKGPGMVIMDAGKYKGSGRSTNVDVSNGKVDRDYAKIQKQQLGR
jgi:hypothetical protein